MNLENIKKYLNKEVQFLSQEQKGKMRLLINEIKSYIGWESVLFILVNLFILFNGFYYLAGYTAMYATPICNIVNKANYEGPENFMVFISLFIITFSFFVLVKNLILPIILKIIIKFGKNNKIKKLISAIVNNYRLQFKTLLVTLALDIVYIVGFSITESFKFPSYQQNINNIIFFALTIGGLTVSYMFLFLIFLIYKKIKKKSLYDYYQY